MHAGGGTNDRGEKRNVLIVSVLLLIGSYLIWRVFLAVPFWAFTSRLLSNCTNFPFKFGRFPPDRPKRVQSLLWFLNLYRTPPSVACGNGSMPRYVPSLQH